MPDIAGPDRELILDYLATEASSGGGSLQQTLELRWVGFTRCDSANSVNSPEFFLIG